MRALFAFYLLAALRLTGAQSAPASLDQLKHALSAATAAFEHLDAEAAFRVIPFAPGSILVDSEGNVQSAEQFKQGLLEFYAAQRSMRLTNISDELHPLTPDAVLRVWSYQVDGESKKGKLWRVDRETATYLFTWNGREWQCAHYHESSGPAHLVTPEKAAP